MSGKSTSSKLPEHRSKKPTPLQPGTDPNAQARLNVLCGPCSRILGHFRALYQQYKKQRGKEKFDCVIEHYETSVDLMLSAQQKCHLCTLIVEDLDPSKVEDMQEIEKTLETSDWTNTADRRVSYRLKLNVEFSSRTTGR